MKKWSYVLIGALVGSLSLNVILLSRTSKGTLRINHTDPEKDIYSLDVNSIEELSNKKWICFKVVDESKSQK